MRWMSGWNERCASFHPDGMDEDGMLKESFSIVIIHKLSVNAYYLAFTIVLSFPIVYSLP